MTSICQCECGCKDSFMSTDPTEKGQICPMCTSGAHGGKNW